MLVARLMQMGSVHCPACPPGRPPSPLRGPWLSSSNAGGQADATGLVALRPHLAITHHLDVGLGCHQPQLHQLLLEGVVHLYCVGLLPLCLQGQVPGTK